MGGCATKPKTLDSDVQEAPEPSKELVKEEVSPLAKAKDVIAVEDAAQKKLQGDDDDHKHEGDDKVKEIFEDDKFDNNNDQGNKRTSLSNLFKEKEAEEGKESTENETTGSQSVKQEPSDTENPKLETETKLPEPEKSEIPVEQDPAPVFVDAPEKIEIENPIEEIQAAEKPVEVIVKTTEKPTEAIEPIEKPTEAIEPTEKPTEATQNTNIPIETTLSAAETESKETVEEKRIEQAK